MQEWWHVTYVACYFSVYLASLRTVHFSSDRVKILKLSISQNHLMKKVEELSNGDANVKEAVKPKDDGKILSKLSCLFFYPPSIIINKTTTINYYKLLKTTINYYKHHN